jgi:hypothetical protein
MIFTWRPGDRGRVRRQQFRAHERGFGAVSEMSSNRLLTETPAQRNDSDCYRQLAKFNRLGDSFDPPGDETAELSE